MSGCTAAGAFLAAWAGAKLAEALNLIETWNAKLAQQAGAPQFLANDWQRHSSPGLEKFLAFLDSQNERRNQVTRGRACHERWKVETP
jgi:hypothetical protein